MKYLFLMLTLSITPLSAGVQLIQPDTPRDQDSYLWKLEADYKKDEVVLFTFRRIEKSKEGRVISDQEHYVIATGKNGKISKKVIAVNPDHFRDIAEEEATWCIVNSHTKFFAKGKTLELIARGEFGGITIGSLTGNKVEFTFGANAKKVQDVIKQFELGENTQNILRSDGIWMPISPKITIIESDKDK